MKLMGKYKNAREMFEKESAKDLEKMFPHGRPVTRRDFLKAGALQFAATLTAPSLFQQLLFPSTAAAQAGCLTTPAFVGLKLGGGAAMLGNFVALGVNRDFIETYSQLGLGGRSEIINRTTTVFGNALFFDNSQFLAGIRERASINTLANTTLTVIPCDSTDDTDNNNFDFTAFVAKAGLVGEILPNLGRRQSFTGVGQLPALGVTPPTPLAVGSVADLANALTVRGSLASLSDNDKQGVFRLINRLSENRARDLASTHNGGQVLEALVTEATGKNAQLVAGSTSGVDPLQDGAISTAFNTLWRNDNNQNLNQQQMNSSERVFSAMVYNGVKGNAGTVNLEMGGYDYHGNARAVTDARDLSAGRVMGAALESAALMGRPLFLTVTSDGAVGAPGGSAAGASFTGDRGAGGAIYCFAFHPIRRPQSVDSSGRVDHQVGHLRGQAAVDTTFLTGDDPALAGLAAFANFLSFSGKIGQFKQIVGNIWSDDQIAQVIRIRQVG
jgi:hypothetical protein